MESMVEDYAKFVEEELGNTVKYKYEGVFYGLAVSLTDKNRLFVKIANTLGVSELRIDDEQLVTLGLYRLMYNQLGTNQHQVTIKILLDSQVRSNGNT